MALFEYVTRYGCSWVSTREQNTDSRDDALWAAGIEPENIVIEKVCGKLASRDKLDERLEKLRHVPPPRPPCLPLPTRLSLHMRLTNQLPRRKWKFMNPLRPLAAATFLLGSAIYLAAEAITALAWKSPGYSYATNWISDLGSATAGVFQGRELNSPLHVVMNSGFVVQGLLFGIATVLLSRTMSGRSRTFTAVTGVVTMIGYILVGTFHGSLQAQQNGTLPLHFTGATLAIVGGNVLALVLGIHWRKTPETWLIGLVSIVVGAFGLASVVILFLTFGAGLPSGAIERCSVYTIVIWQLAVATTLLRSRGNSRAPHVTATSAST